MAKERQIDEVPVASSRPFYLLGENLCIRVAKRGADLSLFGYHTDWVFLLIKEHVGMSAT